MTLPEFEMVFEEHPQAKFLSWGHPEPFKTEHGWVITRYSDVRDMFRFKHITKILPGVDPKAADASSILFRDPPDHGRVRGIASAHLTPQAIEAIQQEVYDGIDCIIQDLPRNQPFDYVDHFAWRVPSMAIGALLGIPEAHHHKMHKIAQRFVQANDPEGPSNETPENVRQSLLDYFEGLIGQEHDSGLLRALYHAHHSGRISLMELLTFCSSLVIAGLETSTNVFSTGMLHVLETPGAWETLVANPPNVSVTAAEEMLRYDPSAIYSTHRVTTQPMQLGEVVIPAGEPILAVILAANMDPSVFPDPLNFDVARTHNPHMAFGGGTHFCLGSWLARMELRRGFQRLAEEFPSLQMTRPARTSLFKKPAQSHKWRELSAVRGLEHLWLNTG